MDWLKKVLSSLWLLPIRLKSNIIINKVLFLKTTISVSKTSEIVISDATIIRNSMKIRGNNSYVSAVNSSITNSQIVIDGDNCHLILQEGTMINNSKIVIRGVNCAIEIGEGTTIGSGDFVCMGIGNSINIGAAHGRGNAPSPCRFYPCGNGAVKRTFYKGIYETGRLGIAP